MRVIGALFLGGGISALGIGMALRLCGRVKDLRELILGLESVKRELSASADRLERMLLTAAESTRGRARDFFLFCRDELGRDGDRAFASVWTEGLSSGALRLEPRDAAELQALGSVLGRYDAADQIAALERAVGRLDTRLTEANEQKETLGKVYGTLGVSVGAALVILLI